MVHGDDPAGQELARLRISASTGGPVCRPISCCPVLDGEAVFVPGVLPREGRFAFWGAGPGPDKVELVFAGGTYGIRKRLVSADLVPVADALPSAGYPGTPADRWRCGGPSAVWAAAATAGVGLVARGRLLPTVTADGADAWRAGPLDPADLAWLAELAAAFPAAAHALAVPGSRPMRLRSPESLIRAFWDAIADTLVRTAAAPRTVLTGLRRGRADSVSPTWRSGWPTSGRPRRRGAPGASGRGLPRPHRWTSPMTWTSEAGWGS